MNDEKEEEDANKLVIVEIKNTISKRVDTIDNASLGAWGLVLPILPEFHIDGRPYILLNDIHNIFNIREDFALAKIAKYQEEHDGMMTVRTRNLSPTMMRRNVVKYVSTEPSSIGRKAMLLMKSYLLVSKKGMDMTN